MLVATGSSVAPFAIVLSVVALSIAASIVARRGARKLLQGSLVVRDGRPALSDKARAKLEESGLDIGQYEDVIAKTFTVNERGEIVKRVKRARTMPPVPPAPVARPREPEPSARAKPEPVSGDDRFHSTWEEQDAGPSIWDKDEKAAFWGDAPAPSDGEKRD